MISQHPTRVERYPGTLQDLAEDIGNLDYNNLTDLLVYLSKKISSDSKADSKRGRPKLSLSLSELSDIITAASIKSQEVSAICDPYMKK